MNFGTSSSVYLEDIHGPLPGFRLPAPPFRKPDRMQPRLLQELDAFVNFLR